MISDFNVGWLAGIIDGEGTITIARSTQNKLKRERFFPCITVKMKTEHSLLEVARVSSEILGATIKMSPCANGFEWKVYARRAVDLAKILYPHLITKKRQAEIVLDFYHTAKYSRSISDIEESRRAALRIEIQTLNGGRFL